MQNQNPNIFTMLKSADGHALLVQKLRQHLKEQPWASIDHMTRTLEDGRLFIPVVSTIYSGAPDGKIFGR